MRTIVILLTTFMASIFNTSENSVDYTQYCNADLSVYKDRTFKSANEDGASFTLTLKNTSTKSSTYSLLTKNLSEPCDNIKGRSSSESNVKLDVSIQSIKNNTRGGLGNEITLRSGESHTFIVNITVPDGTKYNSWSCIEVEAKSDNCASSSETTTLSVFVTDPSEG